MLVVNLAGRFLLELAAIGAVGFWGSQIVGPLPARIVVAIGAAAACWVRPGDTVVVDDPTYPGALAAFTQAGARVIGARVDQHGVRVDELERALARQTALVYVQSSLHSPTGAVLAAARRRAIAEHPAGPTTDGRRRGAAGDG